MHPSLSPLFPSLSPSLSPLTYNNRDTSRNSFEGTIPLCIGDLSSSVQQLYVGEREGEGEREREREIREEQRGSEREREAKRGGRKKGKRIDIDMCIQITLYE